MGFRSRGYGCSYFIQSLLWLTIGAAAVSIWEAAELKCNPIPTVADAGSSPAHSESDELFEMAAIGVLFILQGCFSFLLCVGNCMFRNVRGAAYAALPKTTLIMAAVVKKFPMLIGLLHFLQFFAIGGTTLRAHLSCDTDGTKDGRFNINLKQASYGLWVAYALGWLIAGTTSCCCQRDPVFYDPPPVIPKSAGLFRRCFCRFWRCVKRNV